MQDNMPPIDAKIRILIASENRSSQSTITFPNRPPSSSPYRLQWFVTKLPEARPVDLGLDIGPFVR